MFPDLYRSRALDDLDGLLCGVAHISCQYLSSGKEPPNLLLLVACETFAWLCFRGESRGLAEILKESPRCSVFSPEISKPRVERPMLEVCCELTTGLAGTIGK